MLKKYDANGQSFNLYSSAIFTDLEYFIRILNKLKMFCTLNNFDELLEKATSQHLMDTDWDSIMQLCDLICQKDIQPKHALNALKPKLISTNQYQALNALRVLDSMVKNCGYPLHKDLTTRSFCDTLYELAKTTQHDKVRLELLELIQAWNFAFRKNPKHGALKDTMNAMKSDGYKFPTFRESDAMFSADSAPEWADGDVCHRCRITFTLIQRKHHCRACGQVFCSQCSAKTTTLPKCGTEKEVCVCDFCFDQATKPNAAGKSEAEEQETQLPPEYVNSWLAQQSQAPPPRKTEEELKEEEELQLALAISQSEAEAEKKEKFKLVYNFKSAFFLSAAVEQTRTSSPSSGLDEDTNPELVKYLDRNYWESLENENASDREPQQILATGPSAPVSINNMKVMLNKQKENDIAAVANNNDLDEDFIKTLKSQVEIFINQMKSKSSRGCSIANDTNVQTLFMNITAMHSRLFGYIQQHNDSRVQYERLQDKLTRVKDAKAALNVLANNKLDNPIKRMESNAVAALPYDDLKNFIKALKPQVEMLISRMKSNSNSRQSVINDTTVQILFMSTKAKHLRLLGYIKQNEDRKLQYECLRNKLTEVNYARAALDNLSKEHRKKRGRLLKSISKSRNEMVISEENKITLNDSASTKPLIQDVVQPLDVETLREKGIEYLTTINKNDNNNKVEENCKKLPEEENRLYQSKRDEKIRLMKKKCEKYLQYQKEHPDKFYKVKELN